MLRRQWCLRRNWVQPDLALAITLRILQLLPAIRLFRSRGVDLNRLNLCCRHMQRTFALSAPAVTIIVLILSLDVTCRGGIEHARVHGRQSGAHVPQLSGQMKQCTIQQAFKIQPMDY